MTSSTTTPRSNLKSQGGSANRVHSFSPEMSNAELKFRSHEHFFSPRAASPKNREFGGVFPQLSRYSQVVTQRVASLRRKESAILWNKQPGEEDAICRLIASANDECGPIVAMQLHGDIAELALWIVHVELFSEDMRGEHIRKANLAYRRTGSQVRLHPAIVNMTPPPSLRTGFLSANTQIHVT